MALRLASVALCLSALAAAQEDEAITTGSEAPSLAGTDTEGIPLTWERWQDRPVVLFFASSGSRWSAPMLEAVASSLADDPVLSERAAILVITSDDSSVPDLRTAIETSGVEGTVAVATDRAGFERYRVVAFPTAFTVGADRRVAHVTRGTSPLFAARVLAALRLAEGLISTEQFESSLAAQAPRASADPRVHRTIQLAKRLIARGRFDQAREQLEAALARAPENPDVIEQMACVEIAAERAEEASAWIDRFRAVSQESRKCRVLMARLHLLHDQPELAERELRSLPSRDPETALLRGQALERLGRLEEAATVYRQALERILQESAGR